MSLNSPPPCRKCEACPSMKSVKLSADHVAAEVQLMRASLLGDVFVDSPVPTVEITQVVRPEAEVSSDAERHFGRGRSGDVYTGVRKSEGCPGKRSPRLRVPPEPGVEQQCGCIGISVIQRKVPDLHPVSVAVRRQDVFLRRVNVGRLVEARPEITSRQLALPVTPIQFGQPLIIILNNR